MNLQDKQWTVPDALLREKFVLRLVSAHDACCHAPLTAEKAFVLAASQALP